MQISLANSIDAGMQKVHNDELCGVFHNCVTSLWLQVVICLRTAVFNQVSIITSSGCKLCNNSLMSIFYGGKGQIIIASENGDELDF